MRKLIQISDTVRKLFVLVTMASPAPVLNDDILLEVMAVSDTVADCARLMRTSRLLYTHGPPFLLARDTPKLTTEAHLLSFLAFLRREPSRRCQLLRRLEFSLGDRVSKPSLLQLIDALSLVNESSPRTYPKATGRAFTLSPSSRAGHPPSRSCTPTTGTPIHASRRPRTSCTQRCVS